MILINNVKYINNTFVKEVSLEELESIFNFGLNFAIPRIDNDVEEKFMGNLIINIEKGNENLVYNKSENQLLINNASIQYVDGFLSIQKLAENGIKVHPLSVVLLNILNMTRDEVIRNLG